MWTRLKGMLDTVSTVVVLIAGVAMLWRLYDPPQASRGARPPVENVDGLTIAADKVTNRRGTGAVVLVEFADYECPFCARHAQMTGPTIEKELVESGDLQHVFFNFPLPIHPRAQKAGEAAECAAQQGRFWEMHERLFEDTKALDVSHLAAKAEGLGLDRERFMRCLEGGETAAKVRADLEEGRRLGVAATPAFFVGTRAPGGSITLRKRINGAVPFDTFDATVREITEPRQRAER